MVNNNARNDGTESSRKRSLLTRRPFLRGTGGVVVGLGVTALADPAAAQSPDVSLDVKSNINLESRGVIPAVVEVAKGDAPCFLPVEDNLVLGPLFGPTRLFQCDPQGDPAPNPVPQGETAPAPVSQQQTDESLCALETAIDSGDGATPAHGDGHRQGKTRVMFHFRTQEAGFVPADIDDNGELDVTLGWAVEEGGTTEAVVPSDTVKGIAPMN